MSHNFCPCDNCICVPICRHKPWHLLNFDCQLMVEYVRDYAGIEYGAYKKVICDILNPTAWRLDEKYYIITVRNETNAE